MIYTVTVNPSLDYIVTLDELKTGSVNRSLSDELRVGGKGINVAAVLAALGIKSIATGFVAGQTGRLICEKLSDLGIRHDFVELEHGSSRINTKIRSCGGRHAETEINGCGIIPTAEKTEQLTEKLGTLGKNDILVLSGSLPGLCGSGLYAELMSVLPRDVRVIVDTSGEPLEKALSAYPFLIKPNKPELEELTGEALSTGSQLVGACKRLQSCGARNILVTLGEDGGMLVCENGDVFRCRPPKGTPVYAVGAGDSSVAGFIFGLKQKKGMEHALRCSIAAGSATVFKGALTDRKSFDKCLSAM